VLGQKQCGVGGEIAMLGAARAFDHEGCSDIDGQYALLPQARDGLQDKLVQGVFHAGGFRKIARYCSRRGACTKGVNAHARSGRKKTA
jgi:hypothetical protein